MSSPAPFLFANTALAHKLDELERKYQHHDEAITAILSAIRELTNPPPPKRRGIGIYCRYRGEVVARSALLYISPSFRQNSSIAWRFSSQVSSGNLTAV